MVGARDRLLSDRDPLLGVQLVHEPLYILWRRDLVGIAMNDQTR